MEVDYVPQVLRRSRGTTYQRAARVLKDLDAETVSVVAGVWHWDGMFTLRHQRTRFPVHYNPSAELWIAGDDTPWPDLIGAIEHLEWLAQSLDI